MKRTLSVVWKHVEKKDSNSLINYVAWHGRTVLGMDACKYIPTAEHMNACMDDWMKEQSMSLNGMEETI